MDDFAAARTRLQSFIKNLPDGNDIPSRYVEEYHRVVAHFEKVAESNLDEYRIRSNDVRPVVTGADMETGEQYYSDGLFCDRSILLMNAEALLGSLTDQAMPKVVATLAPIQPIDTVVSMCKKFPAIVRQLKERGRGRAPLLVNDEYDVQYLLHALLREHFDDIRDEEYTPSYAASHKRMDFLLKRELIVVETKMTRDGLDAKKLGEELVIDINCYEEHKDCKTLVCFVYDPEERIKNPAGLINSLEQRERKIKVRVFIER